MVLPWLGVRQLAIVPVWNSSVEPRPADDFSFQVENRVFYDPHDGIDESLQNYIGAVSYGRAFIAGTVFPVVESADADVTGAAMDSLPGGHGFTHLLAILPHAFGPHRGGWAWWDLPARNRISAFARVALFEDPSQNLRQSIGVWAMETLHMVTEFRDLYNVDPDLGAYDVMADADSASHPSAHTKEAMGWISRSDVVRQPPGTHQYALHAIGLRQPPPPGRVSAVRIPAPGVSNFIAEARLSVDQYESGGVNRSGIPGDGVIVYEVASQFDVRLRTLRAIQPGETFDSTAGNFSVSVTDAIPGGQRISVTRHENPQCAQIRRQMIQLQEEIPETADPDERRQLRKALGRLRGEAIDLGCDPT